MRECVTSKGSSGNGKRREGGGEEREREGGRERERERVEVL